MIDIHCHILPGVDDGALDLGQAVAMAKIARADGIAQIIATPHIRDRSMAPKVLSDGYGRLKDRLVQEDITLDIHLGGEVADYLNPSVCCLHTLNGTDYILIEFPADHLPFNAEETLFNLILEGLHPIIAHPERNGLVLKRPERLFKLLELPVLVQITAGSITGMFGPDVRACAHYLLRKGVVNFIASDAHAARYRQPVLSGGVAAAAKIIPQEKALAMVTTYPAAVLAGEPMSRR